MSAERSVHHEHQASDKDVGEFVIFDGGELEGEEHAMKRQHCEPHHPLHGAELS